VKVDIVLMLVDLCKIMGVVISTLNNGKIGTQEGYRLDFNSNLQSETQGKFIDHTLQLAIPFVHFRSFLLMQIPFVPSLLLFFCKFFSFFFCKEGFKEIQPPSQCFQPF
jgi:hypothetical protein